MCSSDLLGMHPNVSTLPVENMDWVQARHFVYDVVYNPLETRFLTLAKDKGAQILGGMGMLVGQGQKAFELFTKQPVSFEAVTTLLKRKTR